VTQMLFLASPVIGTIYILGTTGWTVASSAGGFVAPAARRVASALCVAAGPVALIVWFGSATRGGTSDEQTTDIRRATSLIDSARRGMGGISVLRADLEGQLGADHFTGHLTLKRPNLARIDINGTKGLGDFLIDSNGQDLFVYFPDDHRYTRVATRADGRNINAFVVDQVRYFFDPETIANLPADAQVHYVGPRRIDEVDGEVVQLLPVGAEATPVFYFFSQRDHLVRRVVRGPSISESGNDTRWVQLTNVVTDWAMIDNAQFEWTVPPGAAPLRLPFAVDVPRFNREGRAAQ